MPLSFRFATLMLLCCATPLVAAPPTQGAGAVSIRVHDYAGIDAGQLQQAQEQVRESFQQIGVAVEWRESFRPNDLESGRAAAPTDPLAALTVVIMDRRMTMRLRMPLDVAGYAPVTRTGGGRVAYVAGDRTLDIAAAGLVPQQQVLAGVMIHEIAHLLMPGRSHSLRGVMRAHWSPEEFRRIDRARFTAEEASSIREAVVAMSGPGRVAD
jgi:hypothetical protein